MMNIISGWVALSTYFDWPGSFTLTQIILMAIVGSFLFGVLSEVYLANRYEVLDERWKNEDQQSRVFNGIAITVYIIGSFIIAIGLLTYSHRLNSVTN